MDVDFSHNFTGFKISLPSLLPLALAMTHCLRSPVNNLDATFYRSLGLSIIMTSGCDYQRSEVVKNTRYVANFGAHPSVVALLWQLLVGCNTLDTYCKPKHLLWALLFLKTYATFDVIACRVGADEKTVRKWVWYVVHALADLVDDVVSAYALSCLLNSFVQVHLHKLLSVATYIAM